MICPLENKACRVISNLINTKATVNLSMPLVIICVIYWSISWTLTDTYQTVSEGTWECSGCCCCCEFSAVASCLWLQLKCWPSGWHVYQTTGLWSIKSHCAKPDEPSEKVRQNNSISLSSDRLPDWLQLPSPHHKYVLTCHWTYCTYRAGPCCVSAHLLLHCLV